MVFPTKISQENVIRNGNQLIDKYAGIILPFSIAEYISCVLFLTGEACSTCTAVCAGGGVCVITKSVTGLLPVEKLIRILSMGLINLTRSTYMKRNTTQ